MNSRLSLALASFATLLIFSSTSWAQEEGSSYTFEQITDNLYRAATVSHRTVLLVTEEGVILTDPINQDFSTWLKQEIDERFGVPVRYVLYSHHHWDHASGGSVFEDTATFIGHENMIGRLAAPSGDVALPDNAAVQDVDGNGQIERAEADGAFARNFDLYDFDGNDALSGAEVTRGPVNDVQVPDITYADKTTVTLGGKSAEMVFTGVHTHTDDMSVIIFPEESVGFMVDYISIKRPPRFLRGDQPLETWLDGIRVVETQDFDIAVGGHGSYDSKNYVTLFREYIEGLRDLVAAGIAAGQSLEDLQESIYMEEYKDWISYDEFRESNINDMYNMLTREF
ncbi:MAG: MBL fold metallo-hydrolase [Proteobacteria bacterium]|jgi:glyoxylase-like metal-dependent hydrolase (beta-lactamase superfamily II)|nr:MBL fold metallo-hydrolase [Pseudomonadota bacterium]